MEIDRNILPILNDYALGYANGNNIGWLPNTILSNNTYMEYIYSQMKVYEKQKIKLTGYFDENLEYESCDKNSKNNGSDFSEDNEVSNTNSDNTNLKKGENLANDKNKDEEKIKCEICDKFYTKNNKWGHERTEVHKRIAEMDRSLRNLLKNKSSSVIESTCRNNEPKNSISNNRISKKYSIKK